MEWTEQIDSGQLKSVVISNLSAKDTCCIQNTIASTQPENQIHGVTSELHCCVTGMYRARCLCDS